MHRWTKQINWKYKVKNNKTYVQVCSRHCYFPNYTFHRHKTTIKQPAFTQQFNVEREAIEPINKSVYNIIYNILFYAKFVHFPMLCARLIYKKSIRISRRDWYNLLHKLTPSLRWFSNRFFGSFFCLYITDIFREIFSRCSCVNMTISKEDGNEIQKEKLRLFEGIYELYLYIILWNIPTNPKSKL